jgi:hypothetical protein
MHTERPFFARLQELLGGILRFWGEKFPLTGLDKTLHLSCTESKTLTAIERFKFYRPTVVGAIR